MNDLRDLLERLTDVDSAFECVGGPRTRRTKSPTSGATASSTEGHRYSMVAAVIVGAVVVAARSEDGHHGSHVTIAATTTPATPPTGPVVRYEVDATVLQSAAHGPEFCVQVYQSNPTVRRHADRGLGLDEGDRAGIGPRHDLGPLSPRGHLYDGKTFTLTEPATAPHPPPAPPLPSYKTPCTTPPGGWVVDDRSHFSLNDYVAFEVAGGGQPDSAGLWIDSSTGQRTRQLGSRTSHHGRVHGQPGRASRANSEKYGAARSASYSTNTPPPNSTRSSAHSKELQDASSTSKSPAVAPTS